MADKSNKMDEEVEKQQPLSHEDEKMKIGGVEGGSGKMMMMKSQQQCSAAAEPNSQPTKLNIEEDQSGEGKKGGIEQPSEPKAEPAATLELDENNKQQKETAIGGIGQQATTKTPTTTIINKNSITPMKSAAGSGAHLGTASQQIGSMAAAALGETPQSGAAAQSSTPNPVANPTATLPQYQVGQANSQAALLASGSRYQQLMAMIDELGKDIRPTYNGNRPCQERLKRSIVQARLMVRECHGELEKSRLEKEKAGMGQ